MCNTSLLVWCIYSDAKQENEKLKLRINLSCLRGPLRRNSKVLFKLRFNIQCEQSFVMLSAALSVFSVPTYFFFVRHSLRCTQMVKHHPSSDPLTGKGIQALLPTDMAGSYHALSVLEGEPCPWDDLLSHIYLVADSQFYSLWTEKEYDNNQYK